MKLSELNIWQRFQFAGSTQWKSYQQIVRSGDTFVKIKDGIVNLFDGIFIPSERLNYDAEVVECPTRVQNEARELCKDYPGIETASEVTCLWAIIESYKGVKLACIDLHEILEQSSLVTKAAQEHCGKLGKSIDVDELQIGKRHLGRCLNEFRAFLETRKSPLVYLDGFEE